MWHVSEKEEEEKLVRMKKGNNYKIILIKNS